MKFILVLWLITRFDGNFSEPLGGIHSAEFRSEKSCDEALTAVIEKSKYVNGVCVAQ